jgi:pyrophosphatase PpaX
MAVLLDMDGTLLDTVPFILACVHHAFEGRERRPSDADWIAGIGTPLRVQLVPWTEGAQDLEDILERYRTFQREHHDARTQAYAGAVQAVRTVRERGHPVAVVTGKLAASARRSLVHVGMSEWVDEVVGADSCSRHKPDAEPVLLALRLLDRGPREAVFVGDSPLDIEAGRAAGVATAAALWGATSRDALLAAAPDHLLESVTAIPALVRELSRRRSHLIQGSP